MEYVNLGSAGVKVSRLCLGCMTYGSKKWREWVLEEEESRPFIGRALEMGINFFDTADVYSIGVSEEILGRALKHFGCRRDSVVIATKVFAAMGAYTERLEDPSKIKETVARAFNQANKLGVPAVVDCVVDRVTLPTAGAGRPPSIEERIKATAYLDPEDVPPQYRHVFEAKK